jgi:hypothetical protein
MKGTSGSGPAHGFRRGRGLPTRFLDGSASAVRDTGNRRRLIDRSVAAG